MLWTCSAGREHLSRWAHRRDSHSTSARQMARVCLEVFYHDHECVFLRLHCVAHDFYNLYWRPMIFSYGCSLSSVRQILKLLKKGFSPTQFQKGESLSIAFPADKINHRVLLLIYNSIRSLRNIIILRYETVDNPMYLVYR